MMMHSETKQCEPVEMVPVPGEGFPTPCAIAAGNSCPANVIMSTAVLVGSLTGMARIILPYFLPRNPQTSA